MQILAVLLGTKTAYAAASPAPPAYADHMTGDELLAAAIQQKRRNCTYLRRNRPRRFHALVEILRDRRTPVVRLSGKPPRDPNQSSARRL